MGFLSFVTGMKPSPACQKQFDRRVGGVGIGNGERYKPMNCSSALNRKGGGGGSPYVKVLACSLFWQCFLILPRLGIFELDTCCILFLGFL